MLGVRQLIGQVSVICQQQKPRCIIIQTPDRENARVHALNEVYHRRSAELLLRRCHIADRLMQHKIDKLGVLFADFPVQIGHLILFGVNLQPHFGYNLPVDLHLSLCNQLLCPSAGCHACLSQKFLQSFQFFFHIS